MKVVGKVGFEPTLTEVKPSGVLPLHHLPKKVVARKGFSPKSPGECVFTPIVLKPIVFNTNTSPRALIVKLSRQEKVGLKLDSLTP